MFAGAIFTFTAISIILLGLSTALNGKSVCTKGTSRHFKFILHGS